MTTPTPASGLRLDGVTALVERKLLEDVIRIYRPGPQVLDPATGQLEPGPDLVVWSGPGAHRPVSGPGIVLRLEGQPYKDDGEGRYLLFTPLSAPVAEFGDFVTMVESRDGAAVGRVWRALDPGETGTLQVVRTTWMRIEKTGSAGGGA
ncbi:DUF6093 family protein [Kitasatospora kazusensis]